MQQLAPTVVLDGNQRSALATTRSLGRKGVRVIAADTEASPLAASSRFCSSTLVYPDPGREPEAFVRWLEALAVKYPGAVIMPMTDLSTPLVLGAVPRLTGLRCALPSARDYALVSDKHELYKLACAVGVRVPQTTAVTRATLATLEPDEFRYPVVVKPSRSSTRLAAGVVKRSVRYAQDATQLAKIVRAELVDDEDELLLQEHVTGVGAGIFGLYDKGTPRFFFAHRRVRERPPSGGVSVVCESVLPLEEGVAAARKILDPLGWHGVAMIEFKLDAAGQLWLIEINARFWGSLQLAVDSGADFPWFVYQLATGQALSLPDSYTTGNRLRWWLGDLDNLYARLRSPQWTPTLWAKGKALAGFLAPSGSRTRFEFWRWDDLGPVATGFKQYLQALAGQRKSI